MKRRGVLLTIGFGGVALALSACGGDTDATLDEAATQAQTAVESVANEVTDAVDTSAAATVVDSVAGVLEDGTTVDLVEQNGSGQSGTATFTVNEDGTVHVTLEVSPSSTEPQPAHIHEGTCDDLNPEPAFPLQDVVDGRSETDLDITLDDLVLSTYAVNVHKSAAESDLYVACGDITTVSG